MPLDWRRCTGLSLMLIGLSVTFPNSIAAQSILTDTPEHVEQTRQFGHSIIETNEIIRTRLEGAKARLEYQSTLGRAVDIAKRLIPGYSEYKLRGNTGQTSFLEGLRGANLMAQARELWRLEPDELKAEPAPEICTGR